ncbi:hypothetical protein A2W32_02045 [candidate division WWE3 bacterium RBG_16_37_10]|uniref:Uncharacterized protein n=1 Tax=candidate division WWE3 bacterium RBG_16_37_10 TaxID=1802610 RepID=A0A1F4V464_UNCKA|nr:MAG: hypothetical protein A2W32_02045 [candidate division WWE3 bacterium RBG_16_37_10]
MVYILFNPLEVRRTMKYLGFVWLLLWELLVGLAAKTAGGLLGILLFFVLGGAGLAVAFLVAIAAAGSTHPPGV